MTSRSFLPMTATIPPGATARMIAKPRMAFRPERLIVSPHSFRLSLARRAWTWPLVAIGSMLGRVRRGLARLLRVDLYAPHERREYVSAEYAQAHEVCWDDDDEHDRPFILISTPPGRRGRLLASLGRASSRLSGLRLDWQHRQLHTLVLRDVRISKRSQIVDGAAPLPVGMLADFSIDAFLRFNTCTVGDDIEINVHNGSGRECRLLMTLIGIIQ